MILFLRNYFSAFCVLRIFEPHYYVWRLVASCVLRMSAIFTSYQPTLTLFAYCVLRIAYCVLASNWPAHFDPHCVLRTGQPTLTHIAYCVLRIAYYVLRITYRGRCALHTDTHHTITLSDLSSVINHGWTPRGEARYRGTIEAR